MLIQGTVPDTIGLGEDAGSEIAEALAASARAKPLCSRRSRCPRSAVPGPTCRVATYFRGANTTQYGGKSSISMEGATGSENTGKAAGAAALVISAALGRTTGRSRCDPTRRARSSSRRRSG